VLPCGHWVAEETPELLLKHLLPFLASPASTGRRKDAAPVPAPDRG
jgi:hypothetical protein